MSDEQPAIGRCPTCAGAVEVRRGENIEQLRDGIAISYQSTITPTAIALALDNEGVTRKVSAILNNELRLAVAGVLLQGDPGKDPFFTIRDVEDEAEAGLRALDVAKQLEARDRRAEAAHFRGLSERHQKRAIRITALLPESEQLMVKQRVHGGPVGNGTPASIKIVTS